MPRILLVDDSPSARALLGQRLRDRGHDVVDVPDAAAAAELALTSPPDCVITDLWMPGVSGLQLCRLLRSEHATNDVPVILLTASDDRRSRFWARHAGATAYVTKTEVNRLIQLADEVATRTAPKGPLPVSLPPTTRGSVPERLSQLLDAALYESTLAGLIRALSLQAEDLEQLFRHLVDLSADVVEYRWFALSTPAAPLFLHAQPNLRARAEREAADALGLPPEDERRPYGEDGAFVLEDTRPLDVAWSVPPLVQPIRFGDKLMGTVAVSPARRGASNEDRQLLTILGEELSGPLRIAALVDQTKRLAATDALTGLMNRRAFLEAIAKEKRNERLPLAVAILDVDHFKRVNDTKGHEAGDVVLKGVAEVLRKMARRSDLVARWGGEEFVVALAQTADAGARVAAERLRRAIADAIHPLSNGEAVRVSVSIGMSIATTADWHLEELFAKADKALYLAKARGRNRVEMG